MAKQKLTEAQIDELCALYNQCVPWADLRSTYGITDYTIIKYLKLRGVSYRRNYGKGQYKLPPTQIDQICDLYRSGTPRKELCEKFDIDENTLSKYLKANRIKFRGQWKLTDQQMKELCRDYQQGVSWDDIWIKYRTSYRGMVKSLKANGVPYRGKQYAPQSQNRFTDAQMKSLCKQYIEDGSPKELCKEHDISWTTLYKYLKLQNVDPRYSENEYINFFNKIDNEFKAYWLGFIAADGCVYPANNSLNIGLARKDKEHLERLLRDMDLPNRIYDTINKSGPKGDYPVSSVSIRSKGMIEDLGQLGIVERKTFRLRWPPISEELIPHFVRGYVDGDGCWYISQGRHLSFECVASEAFIKEMQQVLIQHCLLRETKLNPHPSSAGIAKVRYGGNVQCVRIANYLYEKATVFLPRKRDVVLNHYQSRPEYRSMLRFG